MVLFLAVLLGKFWPFLKIISSLRLSPRVDIHRLVNMTAVAAWSKSHSVLTCNKSCAKVYLFSFSVLWKTIHCVRSQGSGPHIKLQFKRFIAQAYTQGSSQVKFSIQLVPSKGQWNSRGVRLWRHEDSKLMAYLTPPTPALLLFFYTLHFICSTFWTTVVHY